MKIDVFGRYQDVTAEDTAGKNVVVIDVYRTTTVIVTALDHGAESVIPAETVDEAWEIRRTLGSNGVLLAGERAALPIEGFQLDNSPFSYTRERVEGKTIVMTTSNGTRAVVRCKEGRNLYVASFLNVAPVSKELVKRRRDACIVCSGTLGSFALEDGLCAGAILSELVRSVTRRDSDEVSGSGAVSATEPDADSGVASVPLAVEISDFGWAMKALAERCGDLHALFESGSLAYRFLMKTGYADDIEFCIQQNTSSTVPVLEADGRIRSRA